MPRKKIGPLPPATRVSGDLADKLAAELKHGREYGQPLVYEQEFATGKLRVTVIWDEWARNPLEERTAIILKAYEMAEGAEYRGRIALASGLTVPEAHAAGILPYQLIAGLRNTDPIKAEDVRYAMLEEGGSTLAGPATVQLRFATEEEAEASRQRLIGRLPGSELIWIVNREITAQDYIHLQDTAQVWAD